MSLIVLAIALILQASFLAVGTPLPENLTHFHTRIRVSQMLLIDALQNALAVRLGTTQHTEAMRRTVTEYTYIRPD